MSVELVRLAEPIVANSSSLNGPPVIGGTLLQQLWGTKIFLSVVQVAETLADALTLAETPVPTKVARLMLVSDVLHNSTAPVRNASRYRSLLEAHLPDIFESLQVCSARLWRLPMPAMLKHAISNLSRMPSMHQILVKHVKRISSMLKRAC